jgi:hypothetical protein
MQPALTVTFRDGALSGYDGCNRFGNYTYSIQGHEIVTSGEGFMTTMGCGSEVMSQASDFVAVVMGTPTFEIEGDTLILRSSHEEVVFTSNPPSPSPTTEPPSNGFVRTTVTDPDPMLFMQPQTLAPARSLVYVLATEDPLCTWAEPPCATPPLYVIASLEKDGRVIKRGVSIEAPPYPAPIPVPPGAYVLNVAPSRHPNQFPTCPADIGVDAPPGEVLTVQIHCVS